MTDKVNESDAKELDSSHLDVEKGEQFNVENEDREKLPASSATANLSSMAGTISTYHFDELLSPLSLLEALRTSTSKVYPKEIPQDAIQAYRELRIQSAKKVLKDNNLSQYTPPPELEQLSQELKRKRLSTKKLLELSNKVLDSVLQKQS